MMKMAFVFPGQGSQSVGMLSQLATDHPHVISTFNEASAALGFDLFALSQDGPEAELNATYNTQPALLAAGVAVFRVWQARGHTVPSLLAGHSLGEYTALVCADALDFADAIKLVALRGRLMQESVPAGEGAMAAIIGLDDDIVNDICDRARENDVIAAANFNSPGQVVLAGQSAAIDRAIELANASGARLTKKLNVSVPSHCDLMRPAADALQEHLTNVSIQTPTIPVVNNVDAEIALHPDDIREALVRQLFSPVRWVDCVNRLIAEDIDTIIECGPGSVLTGLNKRISKSLTTLAVNNPATLAKLVEMESTQA